MAVYPSHVEHEHVSAPDANEVDFYHYKGRWGTGFASWIFSTDHKKIGLMYLTLMTCWFLIGMSLGFLIRLELFQPGRTIVGPQMYNTFFTVHGVIMIFLFVIPGLSASMGNFVLPIMIGAKDVQFPRLNLLSWWLYAFGGVLAILALFTGARIASTPPKAYSHHDNRLRRGNCTSLAPIMMGSTKFPIDAESPGITNRKIMITPWTVKNVLYICGPTMVRPGWNNSRRIKNPSDMPIRNQHVMRVRYISPIFL